MEQDWEHHCIYFHYHADSIIITKEKGKHYWSLHTEYGMDYKEEEIPQYLYEALAKFKEEQTK